jgi:serine/threonine protein phosphatase PrpC
MFAGGVGDSRVYLLRKGKLEQLTTDHSLTQALLDAGTLTPEEALNHRYKNVLYKYLGCKEGGQGTNPRQLKPEVGDRFLLCSDGVTGGADDATLEKLLNQGSDPQRQHYWRRCLRRCVNSTTEFFMFSQQVATTAA